MYGNNVSHAKNRTRRRFLPNLQQVSFYSNGLEESVVVRTTAAGVRTVEKKGGIDAYLLSTSVTKLLSADLRKWRKRLVAKVGLPKYEPKNTRKSQPSKRRLKKQQAAA